MKLSKSATCLLWFGFILRIALPICTVASFVLSIIAKLPFIVILMVAMAVIVSILAHYPIMMASALIIQQEGYNPENFKFKDMWKRRN